MITLRHNHFLLFESSEWPAEIWGVCSREDGPVWTLLNIFSAYGADIRQFLSAMVRTCCALPLHYHGEFACRRTKKLVGFLLARFCEKLLSPVDDCWEALYGNPLGLKIRWVLGFHNSGCLGASLMGRGKRYLRRALRLKHRALTIQWSRRFE